MLVTPVQESAHKVPKLAPQALLSRLQLARSAPRRSPRGASHVVQAISAWSMTHPRASSWYCGYARIYDLTDY